MSNALRQFLFDKLGEADKRIKKAENAKTFILDDRSETDSVTAMCLIFAQLTGEDQVELKLSQHAPISPAIEVMVTVKAGSVRKLGVDSPAEITVPLNVDDAQWLRKLATAIKAVLKSGYGDANFKWICPRTAASLRQFADLLEEYKAHRKANPTLRDRARKGAQPGTR